jgi:hypothetical protein
MIPFLPKRRRQRSKAASAHDAIPPAKSSSRERSAGLRGLFTTLDRIPRFAGVAISPRRCPAATKRQRREDWSSRPRPRTARLAKNSRSRNRVRFSRILSSLSILTRIISTCNSKATPLLLDIFSCAPWVRWLLPAVQVDLSHSHPLQVRFPICYNELRLAKYSKR